MTDATKRSAEHRSKRRLGTGKRADARLATFRAQRAKQPQRKAERPVKEQGNAQARAELEVFVEGGLGNFDPRFVAGRLFATAVQEARCFLRPTGLAMALAAIGMLEATSDVSQLYDKVENILLAVPSDITEP